MTGLRQRMTVAAATVVLAVLVTAAVFALLRIESGATRHAEDEGRMTLRLWEGLLDQSAAAARVAVGDPRLTEALERGNATAVAERLGALGFTAVTVVNGAGQTLLAVPADQPIRLLDERRIGQVLARNDTQDGLVLTGGGAQLLLARPLGAQRPADRALVAIRPLTGSLEALAGVLGGSAFLVGSDGRLYGHAGPLAWADVRPAAERGEEVQATIGARGYGVRKLRLPKVAGTEGDGTLYLITVRETTLAAMADSLLDSSAILVVLMVLVAGTLGLDWYFRRVFTPVYASMSALSALAAGDTGVAVLGAERTDEAGQLARTVEVFRSRSRALRDAEERRARHWLRQQSFIRRQMLRLSETPAGAGAAGTPRRPRPHRSGVGGKDALRAHRRPRRARRRLRGDGRNACATSTPRSTAWSASFSRRWTPARSLWNCRSSSRSPGACRRRSCRRI
ncbi:hypothetical protein [Azospirillum baldaniorum]|uniref:HAMP domain-containing protein n=1 Tax=Azospirillum baldaniorum TaxID=1064539 RepID=A0A9P1NPQ0_9PROT|nr:hypothetical protein [Azospirillum baldaniorum]CCD01124.1 exported protein of unknown function [Azospirillum baldaniorum]